MHKGLSKAICITFIAFFLVITTDFSLNHIFYSPYRDEIENQKTFKLAAETFIPESAYAYIFPYESGTPKHFSRYRQRFLINRSSKKTDINNSYMLKGSLNYLFGNASVDFELAPKKSYIYKQSFFRAPSSTEFHAGAGQYYTALVGFKNNLSVQQVWDKFLQAASISFDEVKANPNSIVKFVFQTSDDLNAYPLCIGGDGSNFVLNRSSFDLQDALASHFKNNLNILEQNKKVVHMLTESGLFGNSEIDISQAIEYVNQNGVNCMGVVLFANGDVLRKFADGQDMFIVKLTED